MIIQGLVNNTAVDKATEKENYKSENSIIRLVANIKKH